MVYFCKYASLVKLSMVNVGKKTITTLSIFARFSGT